MTNETRMTRMTKEQTESAVRHSDFVIPSSLDIRHSSFSQSFASAQSAACELDSLMWRRREPPPAERQFNPEFP
jgi:hypothetical protein